MARSRYRTKGACRGPSILSCFDAIPRISQVEGTWDNFYIDTESSRVWCSLLSVPSFNALASLAEPRLVRTSDRVGSDAHINTKLMGFVHVDPRRKQCRVRCWVLRVGWPTTRLNRAFRDLIRGVSAVARCRSVTVHASNTSYLLRVVS